MAKYLLKRSAQIIVTLFVFLSLVFFIVNAQPGDVSNFYALNPDVPPETRLKLQDLFGVNEPLWKQYAVHIKNTFTGNFGVSFSHYPRSVADVIKERLPRTLVLFMTAAVISFYLGFALGEDNRVAQGRMDRVHLDRWRGGALHGVHSLVWSDDDMALRLQGGLVPNREVPGPCAVERCAG